MSLDPRTKALLSAARPGFEPRPEDIERHEAALLALLGGGVAVTSLQVGARGAFGKVTGSMKAIAGGLGGKVAIAVVASAVGLGASVWPRPPRAVTAPARPTPASQAVARVAAEASRVAIPPVLPVDVATLPDVPSASTERARPEPPRAPRARGVESARSRGPSELEHEVALVRDGTSRLAAGDVAAALAAFDEHALRFPGGALEEERAAGRARALCRLGRTVDGTVEADRFVAHHPDSPHVGPVRAACGR